MNGIDRNGQQRLDPRVDDGEDRRRDEQRPPLVAVGHAAQQPRGHEQRRDVGDPADEQRAAHGLAPRPAQQRQHVAAGDLLGHLVTVLRGQGVLRRGACGRGARGPAAPA